MSDNAPTEDIPFSTQAPVEQPELEGREVESRVPTVERVDRDSVGLLLEKSKEWASEPCVMDQEYVYPSTVRTTGTQVLTLDLSDAGDQVRLASIYDSDRRRGGAVFLSQPDIRFVESTGKWLALVMVANRQFKQIDS